MRGASGFPIAFYGVAVYQMPEGIVLEDNQQDVVMLCDSSPSPLFGDLTLNESGTIHDLGVPYLFLGLRAENQAQELARGSGRAAGAASRQTRRTGPFGEWSVDEIHQDFVGVDEEDGLNRPVGHLLARGHRESAWNLASEVTAQNDLGKNPIVRLSIG